MFPMMHAGDAGPAPLPSRSRSNSATNLQRLSVGAGASSSQPSLRRPSGSSSLQPSLPQQFPAGNGQRSVDVETLLDRAVSLADAQRALRRAQCRRRDTERLLEEARLQAHEVPESDDHFKLAFRDT